MLDSDLMRGVFYGGAVAGVAIGVGYLISTQTQLSIVFLIPLSVSVAGVILTPVFYFLEKDDPSDASRGRQSVRKSPSGKNSPYIEGDVHGDVNIGDTVNNSSGKSDETDESGVYRQKVEEKARDLREEYGNDAEIRITDLGFEIPGIQVEVLKEDIIDLVTVLEDIDRSLYNDGFNTAWAYENSWRDTPPEPYLFAGRTVALPYRVGEPEIPELPNSLYDTSTHKNSHEYNEEDDRDDY